GSIRALAQTAHSLPQTVTLTQTVSPTPCNFSGSRLNPCTSAHGSPRQKPTPATPAGGAGVAELRELS
ncbi:MAG: hypothetical protein LW700_14925, partial [Gemmataceae bacterium]|nr:hypothetical protein [Gemmataceae bacterium]